MPRRSAIPAQVYQERKDSGQIIPAKESKITVAKEIEAVASTIQAYVRVVKLKKEEQKVTGVVLEPDVFDAQKTTIAAKVIEQAAHEFLAGYNKTKKIGVQHKDFKKPFELCESYTAPIDFALGDKIIKAGSWVIVLKVLNKKIWEKVKTGEIAGFSIGGKAKIKKLEKIEEVV